MRSHRFGVWGVVWAVMATLAMACDYAPPSCLRPSVLFQGVCAVPCDALPGAQCELEAGLVIPVDVSTFDAGVTSDGGMDAVAADASDPSVVAAVPDPCPPDMLLGATGCVPETGARPIAPLSTSRVSSQRPALHWKLAPGITGARIRICATRACNTAEEELDAVGTVAQPSAPLAPGAHFWRVTPLVGSAVAGQSSPTWEFFVGPRSAANDRVTGRVLDVNGDGLGDLAVTASDDAGVSVFVYHGQTDAIPQSPTTHLATASPAQVIDYSHLATAGDLDGDGYGDLVVWIAESHGATAVFGGPDGITAASRRTALAGADGSAGVFGHAVFALGDVDGDGFGDLLVQQSIQASDLGSSVIVFGERSGVGSRRALIRSPFADEEYREDFVAADLDCDGQDEFYFTVYPRDVGQVIEIRNLSLSVNDSRAAVRIVRFGGVSSAALRLGGGDVDGDGCGDLIAADYTASDDRMSSVDTLEQWLTSGLGQSIRRMSSSLASPPRRFEARRLFSADYNSDGFDDVSFVDNASTVGTEVALGTINGIGRFSSTTLGNESWQTVPVESMGNCLLDGIRPSSATRFYHFNQESMVEYICVVNAVLETEVSTRSCIIWPTSNYNSLVVGFAG